MPDRTNRVYGKLRVSKESVLETRLNVDDMSLTAFKHSGYGKGFRIGVSGMHVLKRKVDQKRKLQRQRHPQAHFCWRETFGSYILDFIGDTFVESNTAKKKGGAKRL